MAYAAIFVRSKILRDDGGNFRGVIAGDPNPDVVLAWMALWAALVFGTCYGTTGIARARTIFKAGYSVGTSVKTAKPSQKAITI